MLRNILRLILSVAWNKIHFAHHKVLNSKLLKKMHLKVYEVIIVRLFLCLHDQC